MTQTGVPILMYHTLDDDPSVISIPPSIFEQQMRWLHKRGYNVVTLSHLVKQLRSRDPLPDRAVVITFDDGFSTIYTTAFPILTRYRFPATVFLVTDYCGRWNNWPTQLTAVPRQSLLTWGQIRELDRYGFEFGAHTLSHPRLDQVAPEKMEHEILASKAGIEDQLGHPSELFAYPYGRWNNAIKEIVGRAYVGACTTHLVLVGPRSDPLALGRIDAHYLTFRPMLAGLSSPLFPFYLDFRRALRTASSIIFKQPWKL